MPPYRWVIIIFCTLAYFASPIEAKADDQPRRHIIGLYCRDDLRGLVLEEVLKTEGIPYFRLRDLSHLEKSGLRGLVLGEGCEDATPAIERFLNGGGTLLVLKPAGSTAKLMGLAQVGSQQDGYLNLQGKAAKLVSYEGRLQLFGQSNRYQGGETLAALDGEGGFGGLIRIRRGSGAAIVAAFDLTTTLLKLMQPESECGKAVDASHVEYELGDAPQADLLRRLLINTLLDQIDIPVLRKWYFPSQHRAMLMVLGDQDGANFAQLSIVLELMKELRTPYTLYVTPTDQPLSRDQFDILAQGGMDFALHPDYVSGGRRFTKEEFDKQRKKAEADLARRLTGTRSHSLRWGSVRDAPAWAAEAGLQYDATLGPRWWPSKPPKLGYWQGTGLPFYFFDDDQARRMDLLEIPTAGIDNQDFWTKPNYTVSYKTEVTRTFVAGCSLTEDAAFEMMKRTLDQAADKYHTIIGYCWHPCYLAARAMNRTSIYPTDVHFRKCIQYAKNRGIGLSGSNALNEFWRAREKVRIIPTAWDRASATAQFGISSDSRLDDLTVIIPLWFDHRKAEVFVHGRSVAYREESLWGSHFAMFALEVGPQEIPITVRYR